MSSVLGRKIPPDELLRVSFRDRVPVFHYSSPCLYDLPIDYKYYQVLVLDDPPQPQTQASGSGLGSGGSVLCGNAFLDPEDDKNEIIIIIIIIKMDSGQVLLLSIPCLLGLFPDSLPFLAILPFDLLPEKKKTERKTTDTKEDDWTEEWYSDEVKIVRHHVNWWRQSKEEGKGDWYSNKVKDACQELAEVDWWRHWNQANWDDVPKTMLENIEWGVEIEGEFKKILEDIEQEGKKLEMSEEEIEDERIWSLLTMKEEEEDLEEEKEEEEELEIEEEDLEEEKEEEEELEIEEEDLEEEKEEEEEELEIEEEDLEEEKEEEEEELEIEEEDLEEEKEEEEELEIEEEDLEEGIEEEDLEEGIEEEEELEKPLFPRILYDQGITGLSEAIETGWGLLNGIPVVLGVMEFDFIGGSMGQVVGDRIIRLIEYANRLNWPLIIVCASGGARMYEGSLALIQMAKISSALYYFKKNKKNFYISMLASPTTGGVTASFGMLGDIVISEPDAVIAFAGKRVIEEVLKIEVPEGSQVSEISFEKGALDLLIPREMLKGVLTELLELHNFFPISPKIK